MFSQASLIIIAAIVANDSFPHVCVEAKLEFAETF
jgi:hypothetical protein